MNSKTLLWMVSAVAVVMLAVGIGTLAQSPTPKHFSGLINDFSPETINGKVVGPWQMHGKWSLDLKDKSSLADFSAEMTMELSDHAMDVAIANGVLENGVLATFDDPETRVPHTHHISMKGMVSTSASDTGACPTYAPPVITNAGFVVTGMAHITGNGSPAPFSNDDTVLSQLQVCVNGGGDVPFSNVTLVFGKPASGHFGSQAIHGVVRKTRLFDFNDAN
jgi:hypothetical protein